MPVADSAEKDPLRSASVMPASGGAKRVKLSSRVMLGPHGCWDMAVEIWGVNGSPCMARSWRGVVVLEGRLGQVMLGFGSHKLPTHGPLWQELRSELKSKGERNPRAGGDDEQAPWGRALPRPFCLKARGAPDSWAIQALASASLLASLFAFVLAAFHHRSLPCVGLGDVVVQARVASQHVRSVNSRLW